MVTLSDNLIFISLMPFILFGRFFSFSPRLSTRPARSQQKKCDFTASRFTIIQHEIKLKMEGKKCEKGKWKESGHCAESPVKIKNNKRNCEANERRNVKKTKTGEWKKKRVKTPTGKYLVLSFCCCCCWCGEARSLSIELLAIFGRTAMPPCQTGPYTSRLQWKWNTHSLCQYEKKTVKYGRNIKPFSKIVRAITQNDCPFSFERLDFAHFRTVVPYKSTAEGEKETGRARAKTSRW